MKILFISTNNSSSMYGGAICSQRNLESLQYIYGKENVDCYIFTPILSKKVSIIKKIQVRAYRVVTVFQGYMLSVTCSKAKNIINEIKNNNYEMIFLDSSLFGKLVKKIKRVYPQKKVVTFFHNLEVVFLKQYLITTKDYSRFFWPFLGYINERYSCKYSDIIIALNNRDATYIKKKYGRMPEAQIPISIKDNLLGNSEYFVQGKEDNNKETILLFVGSLFYANLYGIRWFVNEVMPEIKCKLIIVGKDMSKVEAQLKGKNTNIEVISNAPSLIEFYKKADIIVLPIFTGSGMKVKTAEALMFGKTIVGTTEAFLGYEISEKVGVICNNKQEFVKAICDISDNVKSCNYNKFSRNLFLQKYSFDATIELFEKILA